MMVRQCCESSDVRVCSLNMLRRAHSFQKQHPPEKSCISPFLVHVLVQDHKVQNSPDQLMVWMK